MRRAEVRTPFPDAETVAAAVRPDNTPEMTTHVDAHTVVTTIERETTAGLRSTLDDYLVNLTVAHATRQHADEVTSTGPEPDTHDHPTDPNQTDTP